MDDKRPVSYYKVQAKDQLLGKYGLAAGSFVLIFALFYSVFGILAGAAQGFYGGAATGDTVNLWNTIGNQVVDIFVSFVAGALFAILFVGYINIIRKIRAGSKANISDVFYGFKNHPDKIIIMYAVMTVVQFVAFLPAQIVGLWMSAKDNGDGKMIFIWIVLGVAGFIAQLYFGIMFSMSYFVYMDNQEESAVFSIMESCRIMKGHKLRLFYMMLSLVGYYALGTISLGLGFLWIIPYQVMMTVNMYEDIKVD